MFEKLAEKFKEKSKEPEITFRSYDENVAPKMNEVEEEPVASTSLTAEPRDGKSNIELKVVRPESFAEVGAIADHLLAGCTVVLNFEELDERSRFRMLDFLNGVTYSTDGEIKQVSATTFIITPNNVDVSDQQ